MTILIVTKGAYQIPADLAYNEFVGPLGQLDEQRLLELHVRYGECDNLYADWCVAVNVRLGTLKDFRERGEHLERRPMRRFEITAAGV